METDYVFQKLYKLHINVNILKLHTQKSKRFWSNF